ncbi:hypothetical protein LTR53_013421 [Teratosphaeriaceae sp. CCFEE 6253]|nr:hypothetical protein LTR53_013421 [Teratosphaeriaceae sp. CCFEE 6253]
MPPRIARASIATTAPKAGKKKSRKRQLDAYAIASHSVKPAHTPHHRLGETIDDGPRSKRRRNDEDDEEGSEDEAPPKRQARRGIEDDGDVDEGEDSEGNEWRLGGLREDDEDSDLDSDEAFGGSDEERFDGYTFRGSATTKPGKMAKRAVRDEDEEVAVDVLDEKEAKDESGEEDDEEGFGEEGVDLATMLDDDASDFQDEDESGSDDDQDSLSEADSEEVDDDNAERLARLRDRIDALDPKTQTSTGAAPANDSALLTADDLYADILADLDPSERAKHLTASKTKKKSSKSTPKPLTAPLPKRQQDRLNRLAASQKAKEQLDRWRATVIHNRRAEFLTFPLVDPSSQNPVGRDRFVSTDQAAPRGELEESIRRIMEESGLATPTAPGEQPEDDEEQLMKAEGLATNHLPVEEVMRRGKELKMARELLFREEVKAKRIAKIKSKSYRRVHRRQREREAAQSSILLDSEEGASAGADGGEAREKADRKRAEARMGTKHRESKFAKSLRATNRGVWDEGAREGVNEQARRQEELRRRIQGEEVSGDEDLDSEDGSESSDDDNGEGEGEDAVVFRQLDRLRDEGRGLSAGVGRKGVGGMKFMRDAEARERKANEETIEGLRREMAVLDGDEEGSEEEVEGGGVVEGGRGLGRAIFGPSSKAGARDWRQGVQVTRGEFEEGDVEGESGGEDGVVVAEEPGKKVRGEEGSGILLPKSILKKSNGAAGSAAVAMGRDRRAANVAKPDERAQDDVMLATITAPAASGARKSREVQLEHPAPSSAADHETPLTNATADDTTGWQTISHTAGDGIDEHDSDRSRSPSPVNPVLTPAEQKRALHRAAFASSNDTAAFSAEKSAAMKEEDEVELSTHLPGWGTWTGTGLSKSLQRANKKAAHSPLYKYKLPGGVKAEDRKDSKAGMERVIVSEKGERKGRKYLANTLPRGFERGVEYERSLRVPVGPEWTTKVVHQRSVRPRVVVKPGVVVGAMERPMM